MKANELRIGNLVTIDNPRHHPSIKGKPLIVLAIDEIDEPKCSLICTDPKENLIIPAYNQFLKFIQPIPLTAEWLERLGFERHATNKFWFRKKHLCVSLVGAVELISWDMQIFKVDSKTEHVHQLQNLFFALTGEDLAIKEEPR